jgi:hypothetical protein
VIGKPKKKGLSIMLLMVSGHIPIMPYNSKKSVKVWVHWGWEYIEYFEFLLT